MNISWEQLLLIAKEKYALKEYVEVSRDYNFSAECHYMEGKVIFNKNRNFDFYEKAFLLFHELGHIYCYNNNIWKNYHFNYSIPLTRQKKDLVLKLGLKAERWVDKWAMKEIKKYIEMPVCKGGYSSNKAAAAYKKNYLSLFK